MNGTRRVAVVCGLALACACSGPEDELEPPVAASGKRLIISGTDVNVSNVVGQESEVNIDVNPADSDQHGRRRAQPGVHHAQHLFHD